MADEFAKGFGILTGGGLVWMVLSGWYTTPSFEETQLVAEIPANLDAYGQAAIVLREVFFWFTILGVLTFWVVLPALQQLREAST
ncbi:hypothetical protein M0R88_13365 [Halorussus gelatinilyticus]|uniref:DUF7314 domain-containing protein n=1 Tax=Halorussus gelatinilyticus TaxID=2937524 RepID=A0A8U0IGT1_9EURY|nr:hypothetical protein [Halorussus gelatinilyticus]UPV99503.1 hypothetical protein M0R88_13365 [Halorussus gelatinilyticus]